MTHWGRAVSAGAAWLSIVVAGSMGCDTASEGADAFVPMMSDGGPEQVDAPAPATTDRPVLIVANGLSGRCAGGSIPDLWAYARLLLDGEPLPFPEALGVAGIVLPEVGTHDVWLEYNTFDCSDTIYRESQTFATGDRLLLAASGARGDERVTAVDLTGRYEPVASQLLLVNVSPESGAVPYVVDGVGGRFEGTIDFEDATVVPIAPGETTTLTLTSSTVLTETSSWRAAGIDVVVCVLRETETGDEALECTASGRRL